jgi:putative transposase
LPKGDAGYTVAARWLANDLNALAVHLRHMTRVRRRWRATTLQRSPGAVKRRTKVISRFPAETRCLTPVWAVLDLNITHATNGVRFTSSNGDTTPHQIRRPRTNHPGRGVRRTD